MLANLRRMPQDLSPLAALLRRRTATIADHDWRDRDPEAHLAALKSVSEELEQAHTALRGQISPRLEHFLSGCSYDKALAHIETSGLDTSHLKT